ncbi:tetratricopeptide repeat protein [Segetibacter koreensis]|uniref:type IX secretion system periplasmic lipoprotein PorW/SprE n=1 Tax=Segetibacter koreensis TaxID=398037 RepID=UPI001469DD30|nr:tetratricopeptide repeat protein [Segetibacter koreensis]
MNNIRSVITVIIAVMFFSIAHAQPGAEIEVQKPKKYENRKLGSEKTGEKKFTIPRKLYQNTVTHYNYYFNANNRLNEIVAAAKLASKDDYSQLLPFYNYSLDATAENKSDLDSVVYKCTAGILLHDLRNSWIDNMYLLLAKAYLFRKDLDSAELTLQYLNFSYAPKEEGGYDVPIGSNSSNDKGEFSIATKEKNSIWTKLTSRPPSRNESFIWQIRTHIEKDELPEASGIIEILRHDPNFPKRLQTDLHEVTAYWFYKQQAYDSAAFHLRNALNEATNKQEKARWEYLIAQMYQLSKKYEDAVDFYNRCVSHTTDPVMDVYARLNSIRIKRSNKGDYIQQNINDLLKMAKRDKYQNYRDIIYYATAKIELERNNSNNAQNDLLKSVEFATNNPPQRSQSFLLLGDLNYNRQSFPAAYNFYDSVDVNTLSSDTDKARINFRKPPLQKIAENTLIVIREDSLQALAKLPAQQRDAIIKKQVKLLRKAQGLKEEEPGSANAAVQKVSDLFSNNNKSSDFYFYNASVKARGFSEFKARWGERPNVDNWRRKSAIERQNQNIPDVNDTAAAATPAVTQQKPTDNSYEGLMGNIPLTAEKLDASNKSIMEALFNLAQTFISPLEEYPSAIKAYEELLRRFPNTPNKEEAWFNLVYAYQKTGDKAKSDEYKKLLLKDSTQSKWAQLVKNPQQAKKNLQESPATKKYEEIYNLFIEGKFDEAKNEKQVADSLYGNSFWTPQLLYIEAIYYVKQQEDSTAIRVLTDLTNFNGDTLLAEKAKTMIDVLKRRREIVDYLTKLNVTRNEGQTSAPASQPVNTTPKKHAAPVDTAAAPVISRDSAMAQTDNAAAPTDTTTATTDETDATTDTTATTTDEGAVEADTATSQPSPPLVLKDYRFVASDSQYVVILLDKVDKVYATEANNAFNRYNKEKYYNQKIDISNLQLDDRFNLVLQGPFADADAAMEYVDEVRPVTKSRIVPWLAPDKYSFLVISNANLQVLKSGKDMDTYKQLIQKAFPGKF